MKKVWALLCAGVFLVVVGCGDRSNVLLDAAVDDDAVTNPDGPIVNPDGPITNPDGPIVNLDGPITNPDAPYTDTIFFDGPVPPPDGPIVTTDGPIKLDTAPPPSNDTCANAKQLTLSGGKVSVTDTTSPYANEYGTAINCAESYYIMRGPQLYYKVTLTAGKSYQVTMASKYNYGRFYIFTGCGATTINSDCGSGGKTGDKSGNIYNNQSGSVIFKPAASGTFYVAVDSTQTNYGGAFTLTIQEYTAPTNSKCASAKQLVVPAGGSVSEIGSTLGAANEFSTGINCGHSYYTFHGNQVYYKVALTAGKTYNFTLDASYYYHTLYIFGTTCTINAINAACGSGGTSGAYKVTSSPSQNGVIQFKPTTSGTFTVAVDSRPYSSYASAGTFELMIEDYTPPTNTKCSNPKLLTLSGGKVTTKGSTTGAPNEFTNQIRCGQSSNYAFDGNQVYYSIALTAGKSYKVSLSPTYYAGLYIFNGACNPAAINTSCGSGGATGAYDGYVYPNQTESITFKPATSGTWRIAVDSRYANSSYGRGSFSLTVEEFSPPTNGTCSTPKLITLTSGKAKVTGDTTGVSNQFGNQINCGWYSTFAGPQLYYHLTLTAGKTYKFTLSPSYSYARFYVFGNTCVASTINSGCGSGGTSGGYASVTGGTGQLLVSPSTTGTYRVAVDSYSSSYFGSFTLDVEEYTPPKNSTCANAQSVALSSGTTTITGNTTGIANEFGTAINCGTTTAIMRAPQLYYKVALTAGKTYTFTLTASYYYKRLYIFGTKCDYTSINGDCGSGGTTGAMSGTVSSTQPAVVSFTPTTSGTFTIAVDGTYNPPYGAGAFTLKIQ